MAGPGLYRDSTLHHFGGDFFGDHWLAVDLVLHAVQRGLGGVVSDQFDCPEEPQTANVADEAQEKEILSRLEQN